MAFAARACPGNSAVVFSSAVVSNLKSSDLQLLYSNSGWKFLHLLMATLNI
jgi:hypothetical protein